MTSPGRRRVLTILLFAGVLSIGPFISPIPDVDLVSAEQFQVSEAAAFGSVAETAADVVGGELTDATGVPEPGRLSARVLAVALLTMALGVASVVGARPVERRPLRLRPAVGLLPDRRGPPTVAV